MNVKGPKLGKKGAWHKDSLWRDLSIPCNLLEEKQSIFDIIMPWVDEQRVELEALNKKEIKVLGGKQ